MTPAERNAVLEKLAQWHEGRVQELRRDMKIYPLRESIPAEIDFHEDSAAAIRALKQEK